MRTVTDTALTVTDAALSAEEGISSNTVVGCPTGGRSSALTVTDRAFTVTDTAPSVTDTTHSEWSIERSRAKKAEEQVVCLTDNFKSSEATNLQLQQVVADK